MRRALLVLVSLACSSACSSAPSNPDGGSPSTGAKGSSTSGAATGASSSGGAATSGSSSGSTTGSTTGATGTGITSIPITASLSGSSPVCTADGGPSCLSAPVDVVRDQWGIPHIYGQSFPDVAYAQGYFMAEDRWVELDLLRRAADGSLAAIFGPSQVATDVGMRMNQLRKVAETGLANLQASSDPEDQMLVQAVQNFANGVNAWQADLAAGKYTLPVKLAGLYTAASVQPWLPEDSLLLGEFLAWELAFDDSTDVLRTDLDTSVALVFSAGDPRANMAADLENTEPTDPAVTIPGGWSFNLDGSSAAREPGKLNGKKRIKALRKLRKLLDGDLKSLARIGFKSGLEQAHGSNNWVIGKQLTADGNVLVANDTHLQLINPPIFYMNHLVVQADGGTSLDVMGEQFPGVPAVTLGMNQHVAWGATTAFIDVTDMYSIAVQPCDGGYCTTFNGQSVPLTAVTENFQVGAVGQTITPGGVNVTLYIDPNHGPLIPRVDTDVNGNFTQVEPLGSTEIAVKYTGYNSSPLIKAVWGLDTASSMQQGVAAIDQYFRYGAENWVFGDDQGNYGWTESVRVPLRSPTAAPYKVLPGDGTAEWGPDMNPQFIPHAYNHPQGYISTANNDPIGTTLADDPFFGQPTTDGGYPLYLSADYDPGTREGRIEKMIGAAVDGGVKMTLDQMSQFQGDVTSEYGQMLAPTFADAVGAMAAALDAGFGDGGPSDVSWYALDAGATVQGLFQTAHDWVTNWTFDTPSGIADPDGGAPTAQEIADSQASLVMGVWQANYAHQILDDELLALGPGDGGAFPLPTIQFGNTIIRLTVNPSATKSDISSITGDPILFDDLSTSGITESKRQIAARSAVATLNYLVSKLGRTAANWRWGSIHRLTLDFAVPQVGLNIPALSDPVFNQGFPRHGADGTVDVGGNTLSTTDFTYNAGPSIRFTCELDPVKGPQGRNVLPGGEVFDPTSPHYRDQMELWRKNQTINWAYQPADVVSSAQTEYQTNQIGRTHFSP